MLHVVQPRDRLRAPGEPWMRRYVPHPLASEPHLALLRPQPVEILPPRPCRHRLVPLRLGPVRNQLRDLSDCPGEWCNSIRRGTRRASC